MKQKIISYLSTEKDDLYKLCKFLYDNPEESYKESKSCEYITDFLKERDFSVEENFLGISNSFIAKKGNGHPKMCYLCEYDAIKDLGHVTAHNLLTTISVTAAIGLSKAIEVLNGSVILIGCPGEYLGGTKLTMVRQGVFDDIDAVMEVHPDVKTYESGTSSAVIPLSISFTGEDGLSFLNSEPFTSLDAILMCFSMIDSLHKGLSNNIDINYILSKGGNTPMLVPTEAEAKFHIKSKDMDLAILAEKKIKEISYYVSKLMNIKNYSSFYEPPSEELLTNITLNRLFSHNLKESGLIDICPPKELSTGLSLGCVSHTTPSIHPYVSIVEKDSKIKYGTKEFASATLTDFAQDNALKAALSLIFTGLDLLESENLLAEVKSEFYSLKKDKIF